jgi:maleylpyruvate isomerase
MQYPGGREQRAAGIAAGRGVGAAALLADLRRSCDALMEAWTQLADDAWDRVGRSLNGERTQRDWVWARWREVEVHHIDLGLGYAASEWPVAFVTRGLAEALDELPARAAPGRPPAHANVRLEATDHDRTWMVATDSDGRAHVERDPADDAPADATVTGWGCDLLAWLYGRDPAGAGLAASGDTAALDLPTWFPFA